MKHKLILALLFLSVSTFAAEESNPFPIAWTCDETPSCSTESGNYTSGKVQIGYTLYIDGGSPSSCCYIAKNIWLSACTDGEAPKGAQVKCK